MNSLSSKKKWTYLVLGVIVVALSLLAVYYYVVYPVSSEVTSKQKELEGEEAVQAALLANGQEDEGITLQSTVELQKKLPVKPNVQQLILDLNKSEIISNSFIKNISISEQDVATETSDETDLDEENNNVSPVGLKKVNLSLVVQSLSYSDLINFLSSLESMKRIMVVENISFSGPEETTSVEQDTSILEYSVNLSAFYAPVLSDLQEDLPRVPTTEPGEKKNPLYQSPNLTKEESKVSGSCIFPLKFDESYFERDDKSLVLFFFFYDRMEQKSRRRGID